VFTFRIQRAVLKPLSALTESVRRYAQGDFERRVGEVGQGEIRELAVAFDAMADELRAREKELVHQGRLAAIGQLAAGVAHELNNPIGIIRGYLKTMSPDEDAETLKAELAILDEEAAQCQRIAEDLLSYSRTSDLDVEPVDIKGLLLETVSRFSENQQGAPQEVLVEAETQEIPIDRSRIRQVLLNLLRNAAQASGGAGPIEVRGRVEGDHYQVDVLDHGPGVAESERQKVFEPFYTKRRGGSGLGLSVVAGIVRAHGGTAQVLSSPSGGALFRVSLPRVHTGPKSAPPVSDRKS
jgi:signal transduction histidine kinase